MFYVYILRTKKNCRLYTGSTQDLEKILIEHNSGKSRSTKYTRPFELVHKESYNSRAEAYRREAYLKTGKGRDELKKLLS